MPLLEISDQTNWEIFQLSQPWTQFTQSWVWGEFRKTQGVKVQRLALTDEQGKWLCAVQGEYRSKALGMGYWFAPRGPLFAPEIEKRNYGQVLSELLSLMHEKGRLPRCLFWRMEPLIKQESEVRYLPPRFLRTYSMSPASTRILDLYKTEEELLAGMHEKTRYNIRVAGKHEVTTRITSHPSDIDRFLKLMQETEARAGFVQHAPDYLYKTLQTLAAANMARLRIAELNGAMLAADVEVVYGKTVTYLYGASSHLMRQAMAPYALHWEAIKAAKQEGNHWYDMWGVNPEFKANPLYKKSWEGISRFKAGWGGGQVDLVGTWDLPLNMALYNLIFFRRLMSGVG